MYVVGKRLTSNASSDGCLTTLEVTRKENAIRFLWLRHLVRDTVGFSRDDKRKGTLG